MFRGVVEALGQVVGLTHCDGMPMWDGSMADGWQLTVQISSGTILLELVPGSTVCIDGVALTVNTVADSTFTAGLPRAVIDDTTLGSLSAGQQVNLELPASIGARSTGHCVLGHIDGVGKIIKKHHQNDTLWLRVRVPAVLLAGMVLGGHVAVDGTSLTIADMDRSRGWFAAPIIHAVQHRIALSRKPSSAAVNVELDVLGKYARGAEQQALATADRATNVAWHAGVAAGAAATLALAALVLAGIAFARSSARS